MTTPQRIAVIGCSGSGKSTFAPRLAERMGLPYVPTDQVFWTDDWRPTPSDEVHRWLAEAVAAEAWVTDGNFDNQRGVLWASADLIVWLDLPLATTIWRVGRRNYGWWLGRQKVWGGQAMTLAKAWSGLRHAANSHGLKRRTYPGYLAEIPSVAVVRLTSPDEVERWLVEPGVPGGR